MSMSPPCIHSTVCTSTYVHFIMCVSFCISVPSIFLPLNIFLFSFQCFPFSMLFPLNVFLSQCISLSIFSLVNVFSSQYLFFMSSLLNVFASQMSPLLMFFFSNVLSQCPPLSISSLFKEYLSKYSPFSMFSSFNFFLCQSVLLSIVSHFNVFTLSLSLQYLFLRMSFPLSVLPTPCSSLSIYLTLNVFFQNFPFSIFFPPPQCLPVSI